METLRVKGIVLARLIARGREAAQWEFLLEYGDLEVAQAEAPGFAMGADEDVEAIVVAQGEAVGDGADAEAGNEDAGAERDGAGTGDGEAGLREAAIGGGLIGAATTPGAGAIGGDGVFGRAGGGGGEEQEEEGAFHE